MIGRAQVRQVVLPVLAIAALAGSSVLGIRAAYHSRAVEERTLRDFATMAAWTYSYRAFSMLANSAAPVIGAAGKRGDRSATADLASLEVVVDSLRSCCPVSLPARGVASGLWGDSASIRYRSRVPLQRDDSLGRIAVLAGIAAWDSIGGTIVRIATGGPTRAPLLFVVYPQYDRARAPVGFVALDIEPRGADSLFGAIFAQGAMLLPASMTGVSTNAELAQLIIADRAGREIFRSAGSIAGKYGASVGLGRREDLVVTIMLHPAAVSGLLRGSAPGQGAGIQVTLSLLALALAVVIALALQRAQRLARLRTEFAASVTHELRTPLTHILLNAETLALQRERSPEERGAFLAAIVRESRGLVTLIDNVLHFSRAERRLLRVNLRRARLDDLVAQAVKERIRLGSNGGPPIVVVANDPVWASVDPDALVLVLGNVIDNAVRHGAPPIRVTTAARPEGAEIVVEDSGEGISSRDRARVFTPFVRLGAAHARHPTGSGIGLAVVAEITRAMGGTVALEDAHPRGLRVRITLADGGEPSPDR